ncbi:16S pseudouridylate synthase [Agrilactobacillus composti DSM 18527 = JCM 14202]|uniref:Pseudouridine synthase n=1 Tax=Agrilactobacillus composti DSM 18527 = JCM 14202 TaxID=1423734 RepID=A0A0R1Y366_9LACO|nr:pseudouridine synthase [Agrilactobacillus composti]KRM36760.1 16S pseudouridylate synthase [Agrilactobacillus composti DSM 18527 = JCM 14202]
MRLDKYLADVTPYSRKDVKLLIKQKRVQVNEILAKTPKLQVDENADTVQVDGIAITYQALFYYEMNKPQDVVSATRDKFDATVLDLLQPDDFREDLFPVGRLDKDTTGLLILSNDGQLAHRILSPKKHVPKIYEALIAGEVTATDVKRFAQGIQLEDFLAQPAQLEIITFDAVANQTLIHVQIAEGKFHQVKRMFEAVDKAVVTLKRIQMGSLKLDEDLEPGAYRPLTSAELAALQTNPTPDAP